jgi:hypothetical protein
MKNKAGLQLTVSLVISCIQPLSTGSEHNPLKTDAGLHYQEVFYGEHIFYELNAKAKDPTIILIGIGTDLKQFIPQKYSVSSELFEEY